MVLGLTAVSLIDSSLYSRPRSSCYMDACVSSVLNNIVDYPLLSLAPIQESVLSERMSG